MLPGKTDNAPAPAAEQSIIDGETISGGRLRQLYRLYWDDICNYIHARFGRGPFEPEDVVQTAFVRLAEQDNPDRIENPRAFLYATARNLAVDEFRKANIRLAHRQHALHESGEENFDRNTPENVLHDKQKCDLLLASMGRLPVIQQTVLRMHRIDRLSYSEIARRTGLSQSKVRSHIARSLERIIKDLKRAGEF